MGSTSYIAQPLYSKNINCEKKIPLIHHFETKVLAGMFL